MSFKTLLYSQWQQQCFVCLRKLFECLKGVHETIIMEVYIHQAKFYLFFSCWHVCPGNCSIRSHNHNFLNSYWPAAISLTIWDGNLCDDVIQPFFQWLLGDHWMKSEIMLYNAGYCLYHNIWLCCVSVPVLVATFSTSISCHTICIGNILYKFPTFSEVIWLPFLTPRLPQ